MADDLARLGLAVESQSVDKGAAALNRLSKASREAEERARRLRERNRQLRSANDNLASSFRTTAASVAVLNGPLGVISGRFSSFASVLSDLGPLLGASAVGIAATAFAAQRGLRAFADYEQGLTNVAAVAGASASELALLDRAALRAAASTRFNPQQTTEALYALASSGQSVREQIATLPQVLALAEAGQADLGQATELVTSTLNVFDIQAASSQRVVDTFVASIGASALNVSRLQYALRQAGPTAAAFGQSFEGTVAPLALLTTAFGNGERAGTGFRALLAELPDKAGDLGIKVKDASGQFLPFVDILRQFEERGVSSTQVVETFGAEAGPALAALLKNGADAVAAMEDRIQSTGQAADIAGRQLDTLKGDFDSFFSAVQVAFVEIGRAQSGVARDSIQAVTNLIRLWSGYGAELGEARAQTEALASSIQTLATIGAAVLIGRYLGPQLALLASTSVAWLRGARTIGIYDVATRRLKVSATAAQVAVRGLGTVVAFLGGPVGVALLAAYGIYELVKSQDQGAQAADTHRRALEELSGKVAGASSASLQYQDQLRGEIALQLAAAKTALTAAEASRSKYNFGGFFPDLLGFGPKQAIASIRETIAGLEAQLGQLDTAPKTVAELQAFLNQFATDSDDRSGGVDQLTDAIKRQQQAVKDLISDLEFEIEQHGRSASQQAVEANLRKAGATATEQQRQKIADLTLQLEELNQVQEATTFVSEELFDSFFGYASRTDSLADSLKRLALSFAEAALKAQLLGSGPLAGVIGSGAGTGGILGSALSAIFGGGSAGQPLNIIPASVRHGGGPVGSHGGSMRALPASAFAGAQHFQAGGMVGLGPGEVPIVAHQGEVVGWPHQMREAFGGDLNVYIVNQGGAPLREVGRRRLPDGSLEIMVRQVLGAVAEDIADGGVVGTTLENVYPTLNRASGAR